jgi:hypothetical protein
MKIAKILFLILWLVCTVIFIIGVLTPLDFNHRYIMYFTFFIFFNGVFSLGFFLTNFIHPKINNVLVAFLGSLMLIGSYEFLPSFGSGSGWQTQDILYKQKENSKNIIAFQMNDLGAFGYDYRTVKILQITPLFKLVSELKKVEVNNEWEEVNLKQSEEKANY